MYLIHSEYKGAQPLLLLALQQRNTSNVYAAELLDLIFTIVPALLVEDSVNGNGSLAGLMVTNDKLTALAMTNWHHGVDWLETGHHGLVDQMTGKDTGHLQGGMMMFDH